MAARKKAKPAATKLAPKPKAEVPEAQVVEAGKTDSKPQAPAKTEPRPARRAPRAKPRKREAAARRRPTPRPKRARRRHRGRYSNAERARILAAAERRGLTALQVQAKFGVRPVTYYSWRKKAKVARKRAPRRVLRGRPARQGLADVVRESVEERLRQILPEIVRSEVAAYLNEALKKGW
jgi:transposase-like protein